MVIGEAIRYAQTMIHQSVETKKWARMREKEQANVTASDDGEVRRTDESVTNGTGASAEVSSLGG